jgi:hypothetical protein
MSTITGKRKHENTDNYNLFNNMTCPELFGDNITVKSVIQNTVNNLTNYVAAYPVSGMNYEIPFGKTVSTPNGPYYKGRDTALGSNYFLPLGKCDASSADGCKNKNRFVYVRNIPTGKIPMADNLSFHGLTGCNLAGLSESRGLIPGMFEDLSDIQPLSLMENLGGKGNYGSYTCKKVKLPVGSRIYDPTMECLPGDPCKTKTWWMEQRCSPSYQYPKTATTGRSQQFPGAMTLGGSGNEGFTGHISAAPDPGLALANPNPAVDPTVRARRKQYQKPIVLYASVGVVVGFALLWLAWKQNNRR